MKKAPAQKLAGETPGGNNPWVDWGNFGLSSKDVQDYDVASWAVKELGKKREGPYFLGVGFFLPHVPLYAPDSAFARFPISTVQMPKLLQNDREDTPRASWYNHWDVPEPRWEWFQRQGQDTLFVQSYLAAISFMDDQVGRVLAALEKREDKENTIVVLWSDHGFHLGEKGISGKNTLWQPSTRVPLLFKGPGIRPAQRAQQPVELLDIYPTLLDLCGLPEKKGLEGHSLSPLLKDARGERPWPAITTNNYQNHAVRTADWRYIQYADGSEELYHLATDPEEWNNLIGAKGYEDIKKDLKRWLPKENVLPWVGNYQRILEFRNGVPIWQNEAILPTMPIPGIHEKPSK